MGLRQNSCPPRFMLQITVCASSRAHLSYFAYIISSCHHGPGDSPLKLLIFEQHKNRVRPLILGRSETLRGRDLVYILVIVFYMLKPFVPVGHALDVRWVGWIGSNSFNFFPLASPSHSEDDRTGSKVAGALRYLPGESNRSIPDRSALLK